MENLGAHAQRVGERLGANRLNHEFTDVDVVVCVLAAIDDVHHRHRHRVLAGSAVEVGDVRVERHTLGLGSGLGGSQGHGEDGIGAQRPCSRYRRARSSPDPEPSDRPDRAQQQIANRSVDVAHGLQHALAG